KINVMDRDGFGVKALVIKRGESVVEEIPLNGPGIVERRFSMCGDYTAYCVMKDGSSSRACEFSVCDLGFTLPAGEFKIGEPWEVKFDSDNMNAILAYLKSVKIPEGCYYVWITAEDRKKGKFTVPASLVPEEGELSVWLLGENRYGRLKRVKNAMAVN
ncbi:MAG TPA: hypothetical protein PKN36_10015, partial [bacterium]|nr:hypothetical protein [bacterium]